MPDKPIRCGYLERVATELRALPFPWVDCATLERVLHVGRRRAQQILAPCVRQQVGTNGVADLEELIAHLERLAPGEAIHYEQRRRERLEETLAHFEKAWTERAKAFVEALRPL